MNKTFVFPAEACCPNDKYGTPRLSNQEWMRMRAAQHNLAIRAMPDSILEVGVRCGYSAYCFLTARPNARYIGLDAENGQHGGAGGPWMWWAEKLLAEYSTDLRVVDTQKLTEWTDGDFDLVHIDADHTSKGALHDLRLFWPHTRKVLLLDDFDYIPEVRQAGEKFIREIGDEARSEQWQHLHGALILWRNSP